MKPAHLELFWSKVEKSESCWIWNGCKSAGYGVLKRDGKTLYAHRYIYSMVVGEIPDGMGVLHKCDNPACVRPDHLFLGTHLENMRDMREKGRSSRGRGESNPASKFTSDQIIQMRNESKFMSIKALSEKYKAHKGTIAKILAGDSWRHIATTATQPTQP